MLCQIFTVPGYQGRGVANMLLESTFKDADKMGVRCFLEVDGDSWVKDWYERTWKFEQVGECKISLDDCELGEGSYRHVAMIRNVKGAH